MSSSNYCFLTCIQISQEAGQLVWYSHLFKNFPQFVVIHTVKGFGVVKKSRKLSAKEFMLLNCSAGENSWESLDSKEIKPVHPKGNQS